MNLEGASPSRLRLPLRRSVGRELGLESLPLGSGVPQEELLRVRQWAQEARRRQGVEASSGELYALTLVGGFLASLLNDYRRQRNPQTWPRAVRWLEETYGRPRLEKVFGAFRELYGGVGASDPAREAAVRDASAVEESELLESLLLVWLLNRNPALEPWSHLLADEELEERSGYGELLEALEDFFAQEPGYGPDEGNLFELLQAPVRVAADSLEDQLRFLIRVVDPAAARHQELLVGLDVLREERRPIFPGPGGGPPGPGPPQVLEFPASEEDEEERFSVDRRWMPRLVLMAKNISVWLDQLSRLYGRPLKRLDEIPEEELARLGAWGMTGLWLIGIWERSPASERIKQLCGNPEAAASAYSLDDYTVARDLGGDEALETLRQRARRHRIRLACDMVPNHMGIDSRWVLEHPDRFLSLPHSPFPGYRFTGPDLSPVAEVGIFLEDHYFDRSDAAVVFLRHDRRTGSKRYLYHGNDGTGMAWNDTAQLDYLNRETREAVIQTILRVARRFPVIRFDAAMTLARRHIQRLWYPEPGKGGDIPSRAGRGLTKEDFDRLLPEEFWRQVVNRLAAEAPDTLLLAEAFWLMEGYFVRTLGMHRVYNSAFMNMLRQEDNRGFRQSLKNTLEFRPEILERFVNYVTTPDEKSAAEQFGTGAKYFGACTLMATLPGLPLFGHGQFEGLKEKYGMEYRRAYSRQEVDPALVARHERQIVPLLRRRGIFAGGGDFRLYDFETSPGRVDENVIAYSNGQGGERALVLFHNRAGRTAGRLRRSVAFRPVGAAADAALERRSLAQGLDLLAADGLWRCRDALSGRQWLVRGEILGTQGWSFRLGPYEHLVLTEFEAVAAEGSESWRQLALSLDGEPVADLDGALADLEAQPLHRAVSRLLSAVRRWRYETQEAAQEETLETTQEPAEELAEQAAQALTAVPVTGESESESREAQEELPNLPGEAQVATEDVPPAAHPEEHLELLEACWSGVEVAFEGRQEGRARQLAGWSWRFLQAAGQILEELAESSAEGEPPANEPTSEPTGEAARGPVTQQPKEAVQAALGRLEASLPEPLVAAQRQALLLWQALRPLGRLAQKVEVAGGTRALLDAWRLGPLVERALVEGGVEAERAASGWAGLRLAAAVQLWYLEAAEEEPGALLAGLLADEAVDQYLQIHVFAEQRWFNREAFRCLLWWLLALALADHQGSGGSLPEAEGLSAALEAVERWRGAEGPSGYRVEDLLLLVGSG